MPTDKVTTAPESEKEQAISDAALYLFAENGFDATAVPRIADRAGVGAGTIYRYFDSKVNLLNTMYRHWKTVLLDYLRASFPETNAAETRFRHLFRALVRFEADHPLAYAFLEFHHHTPHLDATSLEMERELYEFLYAFLDEGIQSGTVKSLPNDVLIALVLGSFGGLVKARRVHRLTFDARLLREVEDSCWAAIRA
jgi:AcrR family transcriptional regulator